MKNKSYNWSIYILSEDVVILLELDRDDYVLMGKSSNQIQTIARLDTKTLR